MSETRPEQVSPEQATTEISYCPHLGVYHYKRVDGAEFYFNTDELEKSVESYLKSGNVREAEFMGTLTAWARKFPHKVATFFADGRFEVRKVTPRGEGQVVAIPTEGGELPPKVEE